MEDPPLQPAAEVTVDIRGSDVFAVMGRNINGAGFGSTTGREGVISMTIAALRFVDYGNTRVRLSAPRWLRTELEQRGYKF